MGNLQDESVREAVFEVDPDPRGLLFLASSLLNPAGMLAEDVVGHAERMLKQSLSSGQWRRRSPSSVAGERRCPTLLKRPISLITS